MVNKEPCPECGGELSEDGTCPICDVTKEEAGVKEMDEEPEEEL